MSQRKMGIWFYIKYILFTLSLIAPFAIFQFFFVYEKFEAKLVLMPALVATVLGLIIAYAVALRIRLKETSSQLIESEKMAALGGLVAGVAHEVNTPLGVALTATSVISHDGKQLYDGVEHGTLKKSEVMELLGKIMESSRLLESNLERASKLIRSFKEVSIDQSSNELRQIDICDYCNDLFLTFSNLLHKQHIEWEVSAVECPVIEVYAGAISQVLSNLIQNSIMHAFEGITHPKIEVELEIYGETIVIVYKDNGVGVDEKVRTTLYEPFVTTARNKGGSGLGMNIVYNLVHQTLDGTIHLQPTTVGTTFEIRFMPNRIVKRS